MPCTQQGSANAVLSSVRGVDLSVHFYVTVIQSSEKIKSKFHLSLIKYHPMKTFKQSKGKLVPVFN